MKKIKISRFAYREDVIKDLVEGDIIKLCEWKKCEVGELNVQDDHVHLVVSVPPKISISN